MGAASITEVSFQEIPVTVEQDNQTEMKVVNIIHNTMLNSMCEPCIQFGDNSRGCKYKVESMVDLVVRMLEPF